LANYVLSLPDFSALSEVEIVSKLVPNPKDSASPVKMKDGLPIPAGVPESVCQPCPFYPPKLDSEDLQIKLIDFGEGTRH
jgi:hypothetical protein